MVDIILLISEIIFFFSNYIFKNELFKYNMTHKGLKEDVERFLFLLQKRKEDLLSEKYTGLREKNEIQYYIKKVHESVNKI